MLYVALFFKSDHVFHFNAPNTKYIYQFLLRQDLDFARNLDCATVYRSSGRPFLRFYYDDDSGILTRERYD